MPGDAGHIFQFGEFSLDETEHRLWRRTGEIYLRPKAFQTLLLLVQRQEHLVRKDEFFDRVWPEVIVTESTLTHCIEEIRKALEDDAFNPRYIKTIPRLGFKFIARVTLVDRTAAQSNHGTESEVVFSLPHSRQETPTFRSDTAPGIFHWVRRKIIYGSMLALVMLLAITAIVTHWHRPPQPEIQALAVLPFVNLNANPDQDYFSDGLTEALITNLAKISDLRIISRTSVMCYKGQNKLLSRIGRELHVDAIVEGSVIFSDKHLRITAQLVTVSPEQHLWAETFEGEMENILALQNRISQAITQAIQVKLNKLTGKIQPPATGVAPAAYDAWLKGRFFWNKRTGDSYQKAIEYFNQAIALDSGYALAYTGLADCYNLLSDYDIFPPNEVARQGMEMACRAIQLDPYLSEAYASLGFAKSRLKWDWVGAEQAFRQAIALNKNSAEAHHWYALHLTQLGRFDEAISEIKLALSLDPLSLIINANVGWVLYFARQYAAAQTQLEKTVEMDSNFYSARIKLGWVYAVKNMHQPAIHEFQTALALSHNEMAVLSLCGEAYALAGDSGAAFKIQDQMHHRENTYFSPYWKSLIYVALGRHQTALELLRQAAAMHCYSLVWLKVEPRFDPIRQLPEFGEILERMNLTSEPRELKIEN